MTSLGICPRPNGTRACATLGVCTNARHRERAAWGAEETKLKLTCVCCLQLSMEDTVIEQVVALAVNDRINLSTADASFVKVCGKPVRSTSTPGECMQRLRPVAHNLADQPISCVILTRGWKDPSKSGNLVPQR